MNDKKTAIRALQKHKVGIDAIRTENDGYLWTSLATDLVKKYIGKGNQLYNSTFNFSFNANHLNENAKLRASKLMDSCITFIETNGIYKEPNSNFITRLSEGWAIALFTFVVGTIWSMAFLLVITLQKTELTKTK